MRRVVPLLLLAGVAALPWGCRELSAPPGGVRAVSRVLLPSPGLVVGDTMRDSLGVVAPLRVIAFDERGDTISPAPATTFIVLDTTATLAGETLVGRAVGKARVFATVAGLQTRTDTVIVTLRPDTIVPADAERHDRVVDVLTGDSTYSSPNLNVVVRHRTPGGATGVDAVIVTYRLVSAPTGGGGPAVVFVGGTTAPVRDTTSNGGQASRAVRWRFPAQSQLPDTAVVEATASYRGRSLGAVQFTVVFRSP